LQTGELAVTPQGPLGKLNQLGLRCCNGDLEQILLLNGILLKALMLVLDESVENYGYNC